MTNEPVLTAAGVSALIGAVLTFLQSANVIHLTTDQINGLLGLVAIVFPIVVGFLARRHVTPVPKV